MRNTTRLPDSSTVSFSVMLMVALGVLYYPFLTKLVADWGTNDDYSHGYFIPFLSIYFIWSLRKELVKVEIRPKNFGLVLIILGLVQLLVAKIGSEYFLQRTSIIPVLLGGIIYLLGWQYLKKLAAPVLFLIFMIPLPTIIWNKIAFPMQLFASAMTERIIYWAGIPIYREGNVLHLPATTLEVVAACSGLRSLMTLFALSAALAFLSKLSPVKKWALFLCAAPIAVVANILRLTVTAFLSSQYGSGIADGFLHEFSGLVVFALGLLGLMGVQVFLSTLEENS